jgi:hypothetical protein
MLYSYKNNYPKPLPNRITLSNGRTRTDPSTFTVEEIADAGYVLVDTPPDINDRNKSLIWTGIEWKVQDKTSEQIEIETSEKWSEIRSARDELMKSFEWRYNRHFREQRLNITLTDSLSNLDAYMQALADVTSQEDPFNIAWPQFSGD